MVKFNPVKIDIDDVLLKEGERILDILSKEAMDRDYPAFIERYGDKVRVLEVPSLFYTAVNNELIAEKKGSILFVVIVSD